MDVLSYLIALSKLPAPIAVKQMERCWAGCCLRHPPTHPFNGPLLGTIRVSRYQKGKTNLDFIEARDSEWQRHQLGHMQVCTSLQKDNHASTPPLSFLQAGCPSCRPTNSVKALKAQAPIYRVIVVEINVNCCYTGIVLAVYRRFIHHV